MNNPGVVVPPVPEKNTFGRFDDAFVRQRRLGLEKCIQKISNHPVLGKDADLKLFLESDNFSLDVSPVSYNWVRGCWSPSDDRLNIGDRKMLMREVDWLLVSVIRLLAHGSTRRTNGSVDRKITWTTLNLSWRDLSKQLSLQLSNEPVSIFLADYCCCG